MQMSAASPSASCHRGARALQRVLLWTCCLLPKQTLGLQLHPDPGRQAQAPIATTRRAARLTSLSASKPSSGQRDANRNDGNNRVNWGLFSSREYGTRGCRIREKGRVSPVDWCGKGDWDAVPVNSSLALPLWSPPTPAPLYLGCVLNAARVCGIL